MPFQVVVYHGAKRTTRPAELAEADVVLTTYAIVEAEHRRYMMPGKVQCRYCKGKFYPDRLRLHLKCAIAYCSSKLANLLRCMVGGVVKQHCVMLCYKWGRLRISPRAAQQGIWLRGSNWR